MNALGADVTRVSAPRARLVASRGVRTWGLDVMLSEAEASLGPFDLLSLGERGQGEGCRHCDTCLLRRRPPFATLDQ